MKLNQKILLASSPIFSTPPFISSKFPFSLLFLSLKPHTSSFNSTHCLNNLRFTTMYHTYATDAQTKSSELAATIAAASTPEQIATVCAAVELFLSTHSPEQSRWFFSVPFPTLICKLFGFDEQKPQNPNSKGWIDVSTSAGNAEISGKVFNLLSPTGVLISSVTAVDRLSLVKYVFPIERLPEWIQLTLQNGRKCDVLPDLCPLFKGRIQERVSLQIQLNIMEYYMFWFAYYPVCKGSCDNHTTVSPRVSKRSRLKNWAYKSVPVFGTVGKPNDQKNRDSGDLYIRLLHAYLQFFVPLNAQSPYRSSLLHYSSSYNTLVLEKAEFFVHTLIHFWIVNNDFSPLSVKLCKSFGVVLPLRPILAQLSPTCGLGEVVNVFVKYLNSRLVSNSAEGCDQMVSIGNWNSCIQRPVYRYILRTFLFCPVEASVKNVSQVFSLWVNYMEPWAVSLDEFSETRANADSLKEVNIFYPREYSSSWQGYVLSNYLFYSSLVMHFVRFAHKFIHTDPQLIVQMVSKVVNVLTSSRELMDLIQNIDAVFHSTSAGSSNSMLNSLYRFVPTIREQLQDWEDGLSETYADVAFLHENWNKDLKLFSTGEDGGQQLLQLLVLRAESEFQTISNENLPSDLQLLTSLKTRMGCLFGGNIITSLTTPESRKRPEKSNYEVFRPRTTSNRPTTDVRFKGDWMKRPVTNDEVAWLVNLLVKLSWWLNDIMGLNSWENGDVGPSKWSYVEVSGDGGSKVYGAKEASGLGREAVKLMRQHGIRMNLRMFASKKVVLVLLIAVVFSMVKRMFSNLRVA